MNPLFSIVVTMAWISDNPVSTVIVLSKLFLLFDIIKPKYFGLSDWNHVGILTRLVKLKFSMNSLIACPVGSQFKSPIKIKFSYSFLK